MTDIFRSDNVVARAVACEDVSRWVITFDNYSIGHGFDREGFAEAYLRAQGISAIHVMGKREDWYQYPEMAEVFVAVRAAMGSAPRSITYGSSMGGYAALRFADALGVDAALALSPQYSVNPERAPFEKRWLQDAERITWRPDGEPPLPRRARAVVVFDPASLDRLHVELIAAEVEIVAIPIRYSGHPSASMLAELQMLSPLVMDVLAGTEDAAMYRRTAKARRAESVTYLTTLSDALAARRQGWALQLSERAVEIQPKHIGALQSLAKNLHAQGRHDEALTTHQKALELSCRNVVVSVPYAGMLSELGQHDSALALAREVASRPDTCAMAHVHAWHGFIAYQAGEKAEAVEAVSKAVALHPTEPKYQKLLNNYRSGSSFIGKMRLILLRIRTFAFRYLDRITL